DPERRRQPGDGLLRGGARVHVEREGAAQAIDGALSDWNGANRAGAPGGGDEASRGVTLACGRVGRAQAERPRAALRAGTERVLGRVRALASPASRPGA